MDSFILDKDIYSAFSTDSLGHEFKSERTFNP